MEPTASQTFARARSRISHGYLLGGFLLVAGLGIAVLTGDEDPTLLWSGGILAIIALVILAQVTRTARDRTPWLVIAPEGLWYKEWGLPPVPWAEIGDIYQKGNRLQAFLAISLDDQAATFRRLTGPEGRAVRFGRLIRPGLLLIPANSLEASLGQIQQAIEQAKPQQPISTPA